MNEELLRYNTDSVFTYIDCETQNLCLSEQKNLPWQCSFIKYQNGRILKEFDYYIYWGYDLPVSYGAAKATRYDPNVVKKLGKPPEFVYSEMVRELENSDYIVGHNILGFDAYLIQGFGRALKQKPYNIAPKAIDTLSLIKSIRLDIPYNKSEDFVAWQYKLLHKRIRIRGNSLGALGKEFDIKHPYDTLHNSLSDLRLNIKVFEKLIWMVNI